MQRILSTKPASLFPGPRHAKAAFVTAVVAAVSFTVAAMVAPARASAASGVGSLVGAHKDERLGFTIQTPKDWAAVATNVDERWVVGKYLADKSSFWTDKSTGFTAEHKAEMQMIAFVTDAIKAKYKVTESETKDGKETRIQFLNPYKDYKDFLTKRYQGGGWFVDKETQDKVGDVPVTIYEIKVEKGSNEGPKRITTWIYHVADMELAVQFECLEGAYAKLQGEFQRCLRSYKTIKRNGDAIAEASTGGPEVRMSENSKEMTPEDRKKERQVLEKRAHDQAMKTSPEGWTAKKMGRFLVVSHTDEKFAKNVVEHCEATWKWLDQNFAFIGDKEYVRAPILRLCKDWNEYKSFVTEGDANWSNIEIAAFNSQDGSNGDAMQFVCRAMFEHWIGDRDWRLRIEMPYWISYGFGDEMGSAIVKQDKLEFRNVDRVHDFMRELVRDHKNISARDLMSNDDDKFWQDWHNADQAQALVSYFLVGPGAKDPKTKDFLTTYIKNLQGVLADIHAEDKKKAESDKGDKEAKTEEEEDAAVKSKGKQREKRLKEVVDKTLDKTFQGWTADDWKRLEDAYLKFIN